MTAKISLHTVYIYLVQLTVENLSVSVDSRNSISSGSNYLCVCQLTVNIYLFQLTVDTSISIGSKHLCMSIDSRYLSVSVDSRHLYFNWKKISVCQLTSDIYLFPLTVDTSISIGIKFLCMSIDSRYLSVSVDSRHFYFNWKKTSVCQLTVDTYLF